MILQLRLHPSTFFLSRLYVEYAQLYPPSSAGPILIYHAWSHPAISNRSSKEYLEGEGEPREKRRVPSKFLHGELRFASAWLVLLGELYLSIISVIYLSIIYIWLGAAIARAST